MKTNFLLLTLCLLIFGACSTPKSITIDKRKFVLKKIDKNPLSFMYQNDTLILTARFAECGEFGGHKEKISIIRTYKNEYFAKIVIDSVNLDCPPDFEKDAIQTKDTLLKINTAKEKAILKYLNKLYKRSTTNRGNFHAAEYYGASKRGFEIHSDEQRNTWNEFRKLRKTLLK